MSVNIHNVDEYVGLCLDYYLHTGIRRQMEAFREGFNRVFSIEKLYAFTPHEIQVKN